MTTILYLLGQVYILFRMTEFLKGTNAGRIEPRINEASFDNVSQFKKGLP